MQVKLCDPRMSALCVPWCKKALYKHSSFPFLSLVESIMFIRRRHGFPTSYQPRFYAAPNFLKMGIKYLNCRLWDNLDNKGREVWCKVSSYKNCQRQSCSAINCRSSGINILAGGSSVPLISERKGTDPHWKHVHCTHFAS